MGRVLSLLISDGWNFLAVSLATRQAIMQEHVLVFLERAFRGEVS